MVQSEVEVKFRVLDVEALESSLAAIGFRCITPSTFERNTLYDSPVGQLRASGQLLRIRRYGDRWIVTHKSKPADEDLSTGHKRRIETEFGIDDGEAFAFILERLGYVPRFTYEKYRTEFADATGHCVIDQTPIGIWAELEGPDDWIDATAQALSVSPGEYVTLTYARLFDAWKQSTGSTLNDLTFAGIPATETVSSRR